MVLNGPSDNLLCRYKSYTFAPKIVKTKVWDFIFLPPPKKHHCEAQIHQIRIKGYPYYLYFDEFLNIFTIFATPYYVRIMTYAVGLCKKWVVST